MCAAGAAELQPACPPVVSPQTPLEAKASLAKDRGMLWRLQRNGRTSYLYGTLHIGRPAWVQLGPQVAAALARSEVLALELDLEDPNLARQFQDIQRAALIQGQSAAEPSSVLPPALAQRLAAAAARSCVPLADMAGLPLLMQASAISLSDARWLGFDVAYGQERALSAVARARGLAVRSLETLAEQMAVMRLEPGAAGLEQLARGLEQFEDGSARGGLFKLAEGWERGDLALLANYENWCECVPTAADRRFLRLINDDRNLKLSQRIEALHAEGLKVFAAVGALHMTGPAALPRLLSARGFKVTRVYFRHPGGDPPRSSPN